LQTSPTHPKDFYLFAAGLCRSTGGREGERGRERERERETEREWKRKSDKEWERDSERWRERERQGVCERVKGIVVVVQRCVWFSYTL